jgi:serine/threonine protein kinase
MALASGARLGPYEILSALGAGGMGEVYRARDTKLNRDVALKILPTAFALDPDLRGHVPVFSKRSTDQ